MNEMNKYIETIKTLKIAIASKWWHLNAAYVLH